MGKSPDGGKKSQQDHNVSKNENGDTKNQKSYYFEKNQTDHSYDNKLSMPKFGMKTMKSHKNLNDKKSARAKKKNNTDSNKKKQSETKHTIFKKEKPAQQKSNGKVERENSETSISVNKKSLKKTNRILKKKTKTNQEKNLSSKHGLLSLIKQKQGSIQSKKVRPSVDLNVIEWSETLSDLKDRGISSDIMQNKEDWGEMDFYPLIEPFAYTIILNNTKTMERRYLVVERIINKQDEKTFQFICETLENFNVDFYQVNEKGKDNYLEDLVEDVIEDYSITVDDEKKQILLYRLKRDLLGLEILEPLMNDPNIEDISCDGADSPVFVYHRVHGSIQSNVLFVDEEELSGFVMKLAQKSGKHISIAHPMIDATMPDGSRIQMTLSTEVTTRGSTFTIRKFRKEPFAPADLIIYQTLSTELLAYFWMVVEHGYSALIAGGTASGKTSTLNAISLFIPRESKIVTIEETREINLPHPNWIPGVTRIGFGQVYDGKQTGEIDMYDLMKAALRQRPEYILVGEIRGREAYVLFQAMATGHTTYSTMHADSSKSLIHRLEGEPINIPRVMLQSLDVICIQTITRVKNKRARKIKQVIEIVDIDPVTKEILTNEVFHWDPITDKFEYSGKSYVLESIRSDKDYTKKELEDDLNNRMKILDYMVKHNLKDFRKVAQMTMTYREKPEEIMNILA